MLNWRQIIRIIGQLLHIEAALLLITMTVAVCYSESAIPFLIPAILSIFLGLLGNYLGRGADPAMGRREGYFIVSVIWIIYTLIGMLPFILTGSTQYLSDAFFETMSGFTSTGATIFPHIDPLSHGILFWRSMTQWVGGIGIIFFTIAILPAFGIGEVKLFAAESTGPLHDKVHPKMAIAVRWIAAVYLGLTLLCYLSLLLCHMTSFDALNIAMATAATGGFAPHSALFSDPATEYVLIIFMFFSGVNYTLIYYTILKGRIHKFAHDPELGTYLLITLITTLICTLGLYIQKTDLQLGTPLPLAEQSFRESLFTIVSMQTTTGFACTDYCQWPQHLLPIILFVMFTGACAGSSSGGFKCIRLTILWRILKSEFTRILHPRAVIPVRLGDTIITTSVQKTLVAYVTLFITSLLAGALVLSFFGDQQGHDISQGEAFSLSIASLSNIGPTMGQYGPTQSWVNLAPMAKYVCSFLMLIGRLEIFPILILFTRRFWKE